MRGLLEGVRCVGCVDPLGRDFGALLKLLAAHAEGINVFKAESGSLCGDTCLHVNIRLGVLRSCGLAVFGSVGDGPG